jgi:uncharacterized membrane protein YczE
MPVLVAPDASGVRRAVVQVIGIALVATGVALTIRGELGVAPYDVVTTGMHERLGIPIGLAAVLLPIVFLLAGLALGGRVGLGTMLDVAFVGPLIGLVLVIVPDVEPLAPRIALYATGFVLITAGIVLVIVPDLGAGPAEVLMLAVADRGHPLAPVRTAIELVCVAVGFAMGGQVGIGTLVFALLIGPSLRRALTFAGFDADLAATRTDAATPGL